MHPKSTTEPNPARPSQPNEDWVTHLEQTNRNAEKRQNVSEVNQKIRRDKVKAPADQRAPEIGAVPPAVAKKFCQAANEVNKAEVHL